MPRAAPPRAADDFRCHEIKVLQRAPRREEALQLLERVCRTVQPVMKARRFRVPLCREYMPRNAHEWGRNWNRGQRIEIRLRKKVTDDHFLPFDFILGTMLHELTHNVHGPHDAKFYKLLDELQDECEAFMAKGIEGTGEGFDARGHKSSDRLQGAAVSLMDRRRLALAAAEKRARRQVNGTAAGGQRLGGGAATAALSPREAAAAAAQRRAHDDKWCPSAVLSVEDEEDEAEEEDSDVLYYGSQPPPAAEEENEGNDGHADAVHANVPAAAPAAPAAGAGETPEVIVID